MLYLVHFYSAQQPFPTNIVQPFIGNNCPSSPYHLPKNPALDLMSVSNPPAKTETVSPVRVCVRVLLLA